MLEVYDIKKERYFIEFTSLMVYFLDLQSALTEMNRITEENNWSLLEVYQIKKKDLYVLRGRPLAYLI